MTPADHDEVRDFESIAERLRRENAGIDVPPALRAAVAAERSRSGRRRLALRLAGSAATIGAIAALVMLALRHAAPLAPDRAAPAPEQVVALPGPEPRPPTPESAAWVRRAGPAESILREVPTEDPRVTIVFVHHVVPER